jgi:hypothetical protein
MNDHPRTDRVVDFGSVVLISVAAVLTALCGYQSGRWAGHQARLYSVANANRLRSAEAADRANVLTAIDVAVFLHYVEAVDAGDARLTNFLYKRFRPEFLPAMRAWLATHPLRNAQAPSSPFVMPQYSLKTRAESRSYELLANQNFDEAVTATRHSDDFLLLTVIFAAVSFLAGISTKMVYPRHAIVVAIALLATIYGIVKLSGLPFA